MNNNAVVTGVLLFVAFLIGFGLGRMTADVSVNEVRSGAVMDEFSTQNNTDQATQTSGTGTQVNANSLSDSQKQMLQSFGIDPNTITITAEMVACAEAKLGAARIEEIKNGATPSFSEGASLVACYR
jgi:hypothetical protein